MQTEMASRLLVRLMALGLLCPSPSAAAPAEATLDPSTEGIHYDDAPVQMGTKIPLGATLHIESYNDSTFCELRIGSQKWRIDVEDQSLELPNEKVPLGPATISICADTDDKVCVPLETVTVELVAPERRIPRTQKRNLASLYWSMGGTVPFWIPVGLLGTNFLSSDAVKGVPLAVLPAGVAFGGKFRVGRDFFLGTSMFCNWSIQSQTEGSTSALPYPGKGENVIPSPSRGGGSAQFPAADTHDNNSITLRALALGGLLDVGGYLMIGGAASIDFTHGKAAVAPIFVIGAGQRFLEFLNGERQSSKYRRTKMGEL